MLMMLNRASMNQFSSSFYSQSHPEVTWKADNQSASILKAFEKQSFENKNPIAENLNGGAPFTEEEDAVKKQQSSRRDL